MGTGRTYSAFAVRVALIELIPNTRMKKVGTGAEIVTFSWLGLPPPPVERLHGRSRPNTASAAAPPGSGVAVLGGLIVRTLHCVIESRGKQDGTGEGRGVGGALHAQGVGPVPGHIDNDGAHAHEDESARHEDDQHLATRPLAPMSAASPMAHRGVGQILDHDLLCHRLFLSRCGFNAMTVLSDIVNVPAEPPPKNPRMPARPVWNT